MIYGTQPTQYDVTLEPKFKQRLNSANACIKQKNEETVLDGENFTTDTRRMITKTARQPLMTRKFKLRDKLATEQSAWEREIADRMSGREKEKEKEEDEEIGRLKRKLEELCRDFWRQEQELCGKLLQKQEDLKRLNLLNATAARDLSKMIQTRSTEYKKDCSVANLKAVADKRNQMHNVLLWDTQYLDRVLLSDNLEEKARADRKQLNDFIVANGKLIELKRKEREEEAKMEEEEYRRQVEEYEREKREENRKREEEKMKVLRQSQAQLNYLHHKRKEQADKERQEKERERQLALESVRETESERHRRRKERENQLEELRLCVEMKQKYNEEARQREKILLDHIAAEYSAREKIKLQQLEHQEAMRQNQEQHTIQMIQEQIEERRKIQAEKEREKLAEAEYWRKRRIEIEQEEEREKRERERKREQMNIELKQQRDYNQYRKVKEF